MSPAMIIVLEMKSELWALDAINMHDDEDDCVACATGKSRAKTGCRFNDKYVALLFCIRGWPTVGSEEEKRVPVVTSEEHRCSSCLSPHQLRIH